MRAPIALSSVHLKSVNYRNSTSQVSCHNQSIHKRFEAQGVCLETLDPQVALSSVPASMAERPPRVTVLLGNWSLVRGQQSARMGASKRCITTFSPVPNGPRSSQTLEALVEFCLPFSSTMTISKFPEGLQTLKLAANHTGNCDSFREGVLAKT